MQRIRVRQGKSHSTVKKKKKKKGNGLHNGGVNEICWPGPSHVQLNAGHTIQIPVTYNCWHRSNSVNPSSEQLLLKMVVVVFPVAHDSYDMAYNKKCKHQLAAVTVTKDV